MFESVREFWVDSMKIDAVRWVVWGTILLMLLAVAIYIVGRLRSMFYETTADRQSYLGTFRELREQGVIEDEEYRKLKQSLAGEEAGRPAGAEQRTAGRSAREETNQSNPAN